MLPTSCGDRPNNPPTSRLHVASGADGYGIVASEPIEAGDILFPVNGTTTGRPTRYSIQVDETTHIDVHPDTTRTEMRKLYPWRFLNHSCNPNAAYRSRAFVAVRRIAPGEPITYNYNTTELDMAVPFDCACGTDGCLGRISGFIHLSGAEQERLRPWLTDYLRRRLDASLQAAAVCP